MPKLSEFYGIRISMYALEHGVPHFHAKYEGGEVVIAVSSLAILQGRIRPRALALVIEWAANHQAELMAAWNILRAGGEPAKIEPLA